MPEAGIPCFCRAVASLCYGVGTLRLLLGTHCPQYMTSSEYKLPGGGPISELSRCLRGQH